MVLPTPLKNMKVTWDDDIPHWMQEQKMIQTTNQMENLIQIHDLAFTMVAVGSIPLTWCH